MGRMDSINMVIPVNDGLIDFPSDTKFREKLLAGADKGHPARANLFMMVWLIEHLTKLGDTILDPCSGVGSLIYATLMGRNVVNIELERHFVEVQQLSWAKLCLNSNPTGSYVCLEGDARHHLPTPANHVIFSPPYSVNISRGGRQVTAMAMESGTTASEYGQDRAQLSRLSYFNLIMAMKEIYRGLYRSLPIGGFMCTITKDSVNTKEAKYRGYGGIEPYSADTIKICHEVGFELYELWQRDAKPSLRLQIAWSQNPDIPRVKTEEIIIMRKPK
jgi:predicted RNA methylase